MLLDLNFTVLYYKREGILREETQTYVCHIPLTLQSLVSGLCRWVGKHNIVDFFLSETFTLGDESSVELSVGKLDCAVRLFFLLKLQQLPIKMKAHKEALFEVVKSPCYVFIP